MSTNFLFYFIYLLKSIIIAAMTFYIAVVAGVISSLVMKGYLFELNLDIFYIPDYRIIIWGGICGIANLIMFYARFSRSVVLGKNGVELLNINGYLTEINEISPNVNIPFYKIDGELFYNYAPSARSISNMLNGIKKFIKHTEYKNIVINLIDSSVTFKELRKKLFTNFNNEFNKIIIIDKTMNVIKVKDGDWLNTDAFNLLYQCPCCGNHTLNRLGKEEVCSICSWIDDPLQILDPDYKNGDNKISLNQARLKYRKNSG